VATRLRSIFHPGIAPEVAENEGTFRSSRTRATIPLRH